MLLHILRPIAKANLMRSLLTASQRIQPKTTSVPPKLLSLQKKFQEKNGLPVHLKGGAKDKMLYLTTMGLAGCGLLYSLVFLGSYLID